MTLVEPAATPSVYFLDSIMMQSEKLSISFDVFFHEEFARNCRNPYDDALVFARKAIGDLSADEHITYVPSPLLSGVESIDSVMKMPATIAMIANGDLVTQLGSEHQSRAVQRIEPYSDELGRPRLRVIWGAPGGAHRP